MPLYEYICRDCKVVCDIRHHMNEYAEAQCPKCGKLMERAIVTPPALTAKACPSRFGPDQAVT